MHIYSALFVVMQTPRAIYPGNGFSLLIFWRFYAPQDLWMDNKDWCE